MKERLARFRLIWAFETAQHDSRYGLRAAVSCNELRGLLGGTKRTFVVSGPMSGSASRSKKGCPFSS
jgi:hypothetical protein